MIPSQIEALLACRKLAGRAFGFFSLITILNVVTDQIIVEAENQTFQHTCLAPQITLVQDE